jgi:hypothetical protein
VTAKALGLLPLPGLSPELILLTQVLLGCSTPVSPGDPKAQRTPITEAPMRDSVPGPALCLEAGKGYK